MSDDLCVNKRSVLERPAAFYDPLGLIQPLTPMLILHPILI